MNKALHCVVIPAAHAPVVDLAVAGDLVANKGLPGTLSGKSVVRD